MCPQCHVRPCVCVERVERSAGSRYTAIRDSLDLVPGGGDLSTDSLLDLRRDALAALDSLTAELAELELVAGEYDEMVLASSQAWEELERVEAEAYIRGYERASALAMADLERVTRERDEAVQDAVRSDNDRMEAEADVLAGLPPDLVRVLRDPSIVIPQDQAVFELIANMTYAPAATASAMTNDQWVKAWASERERAERAEASLERVTRERDELIREYVEPSASGFVPRVRHIDTVNKLERAEASLAAAQNLPLVKGPTTYTTACTCDSTLPGYHRMNCGVYGAAAPLETP